MNRIDDKFILDYQNCNFLYFRVRHDLTKLKCFVKADRVGRGRGHYWSIDKQFMVR